MSENTQNNDLNPDDLMSDFRSKGLLRIIIFTFVIHGVVLLGSSVPWMYDSLFSSVDENASEEERIKEAVREATGSLKDIAEKYGIHPEELSSQFSNKDKKVLLPPPHRKEPTVQTQERLISLNQKMKEISRSLLLKKKLK